ncbi:hypothetical protein ACELLULO517_00225 [Acidisoma cellulosilytica]|uniref:Uncharacterized protein n=1 Tax=Acidisoma cellulosilyticum TaxID=2802395 RepID=A0A964E1V9_9PROT|nr:hypothetical protein [Acidisoma cellulosilyticum]MCB8878639.1 hypothetical protein [Acidisoma cellulosilyticum]
MSDDQQTPATRARLLADQLRAQGHDEAADHLDKTLTGSDQPSHVDETGHGFLHALRDACQTILTAIEAIDPVSITAIDELRLEVDKHLLPHGEGKHEGM